MNPLRPLLSLRQVAKQLRIALDKGLTGVFFIATEDNRSAYVVLEAGTIRNIAFNGSKGVEALKKLRAIHRVRCRFSRQTAVNFIESDSALQDSERILSFLARVATTKPASEKKEEPLVVATARQEEPVNTLDMEQILKVVIEEAVEYLGPMAATVCEEHFAALVPTDLEEMAEVLEGIGREFNDAALAWEFVMKVADRVEGGK